MKSLTAHCIRRLVANKWSFQILLLLILNLLSSSLFAQSKKAEGVARGDQQTQTRLFPQRVDHSGERIKKGALYS